MRPIPCRYVAASGLVARLAAQGILNELEQHLLVLRDSDQLSVLTARLAPNPLGRVVEQPRPEAKAAAGRFDGVSHHLGHSLPFPFRTRSALADRPRGFVAAPCIQQGASSAAALAVYGPALAIPFVCFKKMPAFRPPNYACRVTPMHAASCCQWRGSLGPTTSVAVPWLPRRRWGGPSGASWVPALVVLAPASS